MSFQGIAVAIGAIIVFLALFSIGPLVVLWFVTAARSAITPFSFEQ
jgi:hypothetical protein